MEREPRVWREVLGVVDGRVEDVDVGVLGGRMSEEDGGGSEDENGSDGFGEEEDGGGDGNAEEEDEEESDEVIEIPAPEIKRAGVEVKVPVRG